MVKRKGPKEGTSDLEIYDVPEETYWLFGRLSRELAERDPDWAGDKYQAQTALLDEWVRENFIKHLSIEKFEQECRAFKFAEKEREALRTGMPLDLD